MPTRFQHIRAEAGAIVFLGAPLIAAQLAQISMNFVDTVMAGQLSPRDLAAVAIGGSLWMPVLVFGIGLLISVTPTVARLFGAGREAEIGHQVRQALWVSQGFAVIAFFAIRNTEPLLAWMGMNEEVVSLSLGYLDAISWGMPAMCAFIVLRGMSEGVSRTKPIMYISLLGLGANIIGNYVFMYGKLGMPALGAVGTGVASAIVMWVMFLAALVYMSTSPHYRSFRIFERVEWPLREEIGAMLKLGTPIGISLFLEGSCFGTAALIMGSMGADVVAGHQIAINVASITFMVPLGLAMAISVRVGQAMGRGDRREARFCGFVGVGLAMSVMGMAALIMFLFPHWIVAIYTDDATVAEFAARLLYMAAIFQLSDGSQVSAAGALRGLKDTAVPMAITAIAYWGIGIPMGYTLSIVQQRGPRAMWVGLIAGLTVAAILLNRRFHVVSRRLIAEPSLYE